MSNGTYQQFLDALRAFESGWDRDRYESGDISDAQLTQWAGGAVQEFYPDYMSWSDLSADEWKEMSYKSTNSLGFVGYQFGEALLIDLGYYDDDFYYGNGAPRITWDGTWTGKNGVESLDDFKTEEAQEVAIREAFGYNLQVIEKMLAAQGKSVDDYIGTTGRYQDGGQTVEVEITLTGLLAAAHLRGGTGAVNLLLNDAVSQDEYGTSILQYMEQFGGFDAPSVAEAIEYFESRKTGDEGLGTPDDGMNNSITIDNADVVVNWDYGEQTVVADFDADVDTIYIAWVSAAHLVVSETSAGVVFSIPSNMHTVTLQGVKLADLEMSRIHAEDQSARDELKMHISSADDGDDGDDPTDDDDIERDDVTVDNATHVIDWAWGKTVVDENFDPAMDTIFINRMPADKVYITETAGNVVFSVPTNKQTLTLVGVTLDDLNPSHINAKNKGMVSEIDYVLSGGTMGAIDDPILITEDNATHAIEWNWGRKVSDPDFDPASDTIYIGRMPPSKITIEEMDGNLVFSVPSNKQTLTLEGIGFKDLDPEMIYVMNKKVRADLYQRIEDAADMGEDPHDPEDPHDGMEGMMTTISLETGNQQVTFDASKDMVHIEAGVTGERFDIFEESGDALGLTTRMVVLDEMGMVQSTTILLGVGLDDLSLANFSIAEQSALNEVVAAINAVVTNPGDGTDGYPVLYDNDGTYAQGAGESEMGGIRYIGGAGGDDIVGFDVTKDQVDVGGTSVHGLIITKTPAGELVLDNPWTGAMKIVQGVNIQDMTMDNFAVVGNEHLRQDIGGVMSWELDVGPRNADTVYVRSHEYGVSETVDNFDPTTMKISFLYFGTRERLSVEDTDAGLEISSLPTGQSMTLTGVKKADLIPGLLEFHHDQVVEDNLEVPFGFSAEAVTLVSRGELLTPSAPAGATTDGYQTRPGDFTGANVDYEEPTGGGNTDRDLKQYDKVALNDGASDTVAIEWSWIDREAYSGFDVDNDVINFGTLNSENLSVFENDGNLFIEVYEHGGNSTALLGVQAEDLSEANLRAPGWNNVIREGSDFMDQLVDLGFEFG